MWSKELLIYLEIIYILVSIAYFAGQLPKGLALRGKQKVYASSRVTFLIITIGVAIVQSWFTHDYFVQYLNTDAIVGAVLSWMLGLIIILVHMAPTRPLELSLLLGIDLISEEPA